MRSDFTLRISDLFIQWRAASLKEAKAVVTQYHQYLKENSLIRSIFEPDILPPESQDSGSSGAGAKERH
jgi:hypothetical protein